MPIFHKNTGLIQKCRLHQFTWWTVQIVNHHVVRNVSNFVWLPLSALGATFVILILNISPSIFSILSLCRVVMQCNEIAFQSYFFFIKEKHCAVETRHSEVFSPILEYGLWLFSSPFLNFQHALKNMAFRTVCTNLSSWMNWSKIFFHAYSVPLLISSLRLFKPQSKSNYFYPSCFNIMRGLSIEVLAHHVPKIIFRGFVLCYTVSHFMDSASPSSIPDKHP